MVGYRIAQQRCGVLLPTLLMCGMMAGCGELGTLPLAGDVPALESDVLAVELQEGYPADIGRPCILLGGPRTTTHQALLEELNGYRAEQGLAPLVYSKVLEQTIDAHVSDLWERGFFSHTNPDGEGPGDRAVRSGFCHTYVGENIAAGQKSIAQVMQAWKDSPSHDANMLEPEYVYVGIGFFVDPAGRHYWGQTFAYELP